MSLIKPVIIFSISILVNLVLSGVSFAVHNGSVGECDFCHNVHGGNFLLMKGADQSSTCLRCHAYFQMGRRVTVISASGPVDIQMTPAGDFAWLKMDQVSAVPPSGNIIASRDNRGHNIKAVDFDLHQDTVNSLAPGGTYPTQHLTCVSCHDPHNQHRRIDNAGTKIKHMEYSIVGSGSAGWNATQSEPVGVYRMLGGIGYSSFGGGFFINPAPDAVAAGDGLEIYVAYGKGMSEWCANCHPNFLHNIYTKGSKGQMHPAGNDARLTPEIVKIYNTDALYNDRSLTAYSALVPVEEGITDYPTLALHAKSWHFNYRVDEAANVMCLTCHRAHASAWKNALRQYPLSNNDPLLQDLAVDASMAKEHFSLERNETFRGMFCNKCHGADR